MDKRSRHYVTGYKGYYLAFGENGIYWTGNVYASDVYVTPHLHDAQEVTNKYKGTKIETWVVQTDEEKTGDGGGNRGKYDEAIAALEAVIKLPADEIVSHEAQKRFVAAQQAAQNALPILLDAKNGCCGRRTVRGMHEKCSECPL